MPVIVARGLLKSFGARTLFQDLDLSIEDGERVGLVGNNGSGKSTLARIIGATGEFVAGSRRRDDEADAGTVVSRGGARTLYLPQEPVFAPDMTARAVVDGALAAWHEARAKHHAISERLERGDGDHEILLSAQVELEHVIDRFGGWHADHIVPAALTAMGIHDTEVIVEQMSGGQKRRVALARLLAAAPDLAILDEPTNHLDIDAIEQLETWLTSRFRGAILLVTHDRYLLDSVVDRTLELDQGKLFSYAGGWGAYLEAKAARIELAEKAEANRQNFLRTEIDWLRRSPSARSTKQKARIERAETAIAERGPNRERAPTLAFQGTKFGKTILELKSLSLAVDGRQLVTALDLIVQKGDRIGILGPNGAGKTTLLKAVTLSDSQQHVVKTGEVVVGPHTRFAYFDQARSGLSDDQSIAETVAGQKEKLTMKVDGEETVVDIRSYMSRFLFAPDRLREKVGNLSGGERARVLLARLLLEPANVLVLDEPTNDLDVTTLSALEQMLVEAEATALVVSHDRYFLDRICTAILEFSGDGRVIRWAGNYETFRRLKADALAATKKAESPVSEKPKAKTVSKGLSYKEKLELEKLPRQIEETEARMNELTEVLSQPETYAKRAAEVPELTKERERLELEVLALMERWEDLETRSKT